MFSSTTTTINEYSILECPPMSSLLMTKTTTPTKWKSNTAATATATAAAAEIAPSCPRCASSNTKFCYYNNYSLSQPRYFCKGCRRYWTKGGSLRNVPVGGGCRKSRRARAAARQSGAQSYLGSTSSPVSGGSSTNESETGADIDLAAVFANYVNQNVDSNKESSSPGASSGSSENFLALEDDAMFEYQKEVDLINGEGFDQMQQVLVPDQISMHEEINGQEFASGVFEMQHDELAADMLWLDSTDLQDFGSENGSTVQIQDFGLFSPDDDQLSLSANLVTDNWGSFDLSAYELFSRPS